MPDNFNFNTNAAALITMQERSDLQKTNLRPVVLRSPTGREKYGFFHRWVNHFILSEPNGYYEVMALVELDTGKVERWDAEALTFTDRKTLQEE